MLRKLQPLTYLLLITLFILASVNRVCAADINPFPDGAMAPDFSVTGMNSKPVHLSDYKGKIVVLDFWASWCPWCDKDMPAMEDISLKYKDKPVVVFGVSVHDTADDAFAYITSHPQYTYSFAFDPLSREAGNVYDEYHISGLPETYVIDSTGTIVSHVEGYLDTNEEQLTSLIETGLNNLYAPPSINDGEILLTGTISKIYDGKSSLQIAAASVTDSDGETTTFDSVHLKTILVGSDTTVICTALANTVAQLPAGTQVYVVGKDSGKGKPLTARVIKVIPSK